MRTASAPATISIKNLGWGGVGRREVESPAAVRKIGISAQSYLTARDVLNKLALYGGELFPFTTVDAFLSACYSRKKFAHGVGCIVL